jgi:hypothetical protein
MRRLKRSAAALLALGTAFALTPTAGAQEDVTPIFNFGESVLRPAGLFKVTIQEGTCPGGPVSITSPGFAAVDLPSLTGTFVGQEGVYTATLKCKGTAKVGEQQFVLTAPAPPVSGSFLDKDEYAPGERIKIFLRDTHRCGYTATSNGFTAPAELTLVRPGYSLEGATTAVATPGTYQASIPCGMTGPVVDTFTIKAAPTPPPGNPAPKPKPPIVKPKGAPDTGGGGTA